jgi:leader peptidase (prepilin peptidase)/N-methyltransferase
VFALIAAAIWQCFHNFYALSLLAFLSPLLAAAKVDGARGVIPDSITLPGIALGLALFTFLPIEWDRTAYVLLANPAMTRFLAVVMATLLASSSLLWLALLFESATGRDGMGFGDVKLAGLLGTFLGWGGALRVLCYAAWLALLLECVRRLWQRPRITFGRSLPFAPHIAGGALLHVGLLGLAHFL